MMNPMDPANYMPEEFARQVAKQRAELQKAVAMVHDAHSRTGLMARFLQRMADRIDPTGEARRNI